MEIEGYETYEKKQINGIVWLYATRENEKYRLRRLNSPRFPNLHYSEELRDSMTREFNSTLFTRKNACIQLGRRRCEFLNIAVDFLTDRRFLYEVYPMKPLNYKDTLNNDVFLPIEQNRYIREYENGVIVTSWYTDSFKEVYIELIENATDEAMDRTLDDFVKSMGNKIIYYNANENELSHFMETGFEKSSDSPYAVLASNKEIPMVKPI